MRTGILMCLFVMFLCLIPSGFAQTAIIADHTCIDYSQIPAAWIQAAKDNLRIGYSHTSHGSQLISGMSAMEDALAGIWVFDMSTWGPVAGVFMNDDWASGDLGHSGDLTWRDSTVAQLNLPGNDRNVIVWSWCGGVSDNTEGGINTYLNAMNQLELDYPGVTFIYMTGHLDGGGESGNLNVRNNQIRAYCQANNKVLFDFADIESYDPDAVTHYMPLLCNDGCFYDSDNNGTLDANWAMDWVAANPGAEYTSISSACSYCAHSEGLNCAMKSAAFWWLLARVAGWDGEPASPTDIPATSSWGLVLLIGCFSAFLFKKLTL